ncbi:copper resistance protein CopC [Cellulomonas sp. HZM]|uniref:copper resistance CopC family protein n=1 Tax=Cellulomonas sp. HZM TaxID=1454010 RepID=UPI00069087D0|nr:copper resistance protein CopC [Cellulomonas sp. HZM]
MPLASRRRATGRKTTRALVGLTLGLGLLPAVGLGLALVAAPAQAHDVLVGTTPADGSTVDVPPAKVTIEFEEPAVALGTEVRVTGPDGSVVSTGDPELVDTSVSQALEEDLPAGSYAVTWRVTSQDGHAVSGTFAFTAKTSQAPAPSATESSGPAGSPSADSPDASDDSGAGSPVSSPTTPPTSSSATSSSDTAPSAGATWGVVVAGLALGAVVGLLGWWRARRRRDGNGPTGQS